MKTEEYKRANKALWDERAELHLESDFYDVEGFLAGNTTLSAYELEELGSVAGKSLLHLQCHFGLDTLSWARLGARAVGVDFSEKAIEIAQDLNEKLALDAEFVCADIYELPAVLKGRYDIVYTSNGVLAWLSDLRKWARVISHFLKPGGTFYLTDFHPFAWVFDDEGELTELKVRYPYFYSPEPLELEVQGSYADRQAEMRQEVEYEWAHNVGDVLNALISAGLRIDYFHEFPFSMYEMFPGLMTQDRDGLWRLKEHEDSVPLMFSLQAHK